MMKPAAVIFDLDGTLADSLSDITAACNHALLSQNLPTFQCDHIRHLAGLGNNLLIHGLLRTALNADPSPAQLSAAIEEKTRYEAENPTSHTPFPHVYDMLLRLQTANMPMAVLSNRREQQVRHTVASIFPRISFTYVAGARLDTPVKPHPAAALRILKHHFPSLCASQVVFVGDTHVDMQTAIAAGMKPVGVSWGNRTKQVLLKHGALFVADTPLQIENFILSSSSSL